MFAMQTSHKIVAFVIYSVLLFGAGWGLRPAEIKKEYVKVEVESEKKAASDDSNLKKSTKTTIHTDGTITIEEMLDWQKRIREYHESQKASVEKKIEVVIRQPRVIASIIPSYNFKTDKFNYKDVAIQGNVFGNAYLGVGYEQRDLGDGRKEDVIKSPFSMAW